MKKRIGALFYLSTNFVLFSLKGHMAWVLYSQGLVWARVDDPLLDTAIFLESMKKDEDHVY